MRDIGSPSALVQQTTDLLINFDLLKAATSTNAKPEIVLPRFGRHIALSRWRSRPLNTISGFAFVDIAAFRRSKVYERTKFRRPISIDGWDLTTSVFEKQTSAILEIYFRFRPFARNLHIILHQAIPNFVQIEAPTVEIWRHIHFSRWRPRWLNTTSGFVSVDVTAFRRSKSINKINFLDINSQHYINL